MTGQEIEIQRVISYIRSCIEAGIDTTITIDKSRNHFILNALEEIQQYRAIGTIEECREAMEKQRTKKPIRTDMCTCPKCGTHNEIIKKRRNTVNQDIVYCWHCGQAIEVRRSDTP